MYHLATATSPPPVLQASSPVFVNNKLNCQSQSSRPHADVIPQQGLILIYLHFSTFH